MDLQVFLDHLAIQLIVPTRVARYDLPVRDVERFAHVTTEGNKDGLVLTLADGSQFVLEVRKVGAA